MAMGALSPNQDHVRRILHQAGRSPVALTVSIVQVAVAVAVIAAGAAVDAALGNGSCSAPWQPPTWRP